MSIYDAAMRYGEEGVPLLVIAGKEYGSGSSRDWAAKGPKLLGVQAVLAESFERIHRSNLVGMGILPLEFERGTSREALGLTGKETYAIEGVSGGEASARARYPGRDGEDVLRDCPGRHPGGVPVLQERRDSSVRAAAARGGAGGGVS